jgi:hypothetical protein
MTCVVIDAASPVVVDEFTVKDQVAAAPAEPVVPLNDTVAPLLEAVRKLGILVGETDVTV